MHVLYTILYIHIIFSIFSPPHFYLVTRGFLGTVLHFLLASEDIKMTILDLWPYIILITHLFHTDVYIHIYKLYLIYFAFFHLSPSFSHSPYLTSLFLKRFYNKKNNIKKHLANATCKCA